jgi:hypothetical protein
MTSGRFASCSRYAHQFRRHHCCGPAGPNRGSASLVAEAAAGERRYRTSRAADDGRSTRIQSFLKEQIGGVAASAKVREWVKLRSTCICFPLRARTRTSRDAVGTSHLCQQETHAPQRKPPTLDGCGPTRTRLTRLAGRGRRVNGCGVALDFSCEMDCSRLDDFADVDRRAAPRGEDRWRQTSVSFCPL